MTPQETWTKRVPRIFDTKSDPGEPWRWPRIAPRTWLLGTGWRRRGLIDPAVGPRTGSPVRR